MELNNTRKAKRDILFFNRVPKVGSQLTMELLKSLSLKNKFHYHKDKTQKVEVIKLTHSQEVSGDIKRASRAKSMKISEDTDLENMTNAEIDAAIEGINIHSIHL